MSLFFPPNYLIIIIVLILILILILLLTFNYSNKLSKKFDRLLISLNDIENIIVKLTNQSNENSKLLEEIGLKQKQLNEILEKNRLDIIRLSDGIGSQTQMSKAIELARSGASISEIKISTGLTDVEAEAIAKFHNPNLK